MNKRKEVHRDMGRPEPGGAPSMYAQVIAHEESRYAYFNTTQGVLYGDPRQEELRAVRKALDDAAIAYLFNDDEGHPWPTFHAGKMTGVGLDEISCMIAKLS